MGTEHWAKTQLSQITTIIMGQSPPSTAYNIYGKGVPFFQGKAEFGEVSPIPVKFCTQPLRIAETGDILISVRAPVGPTNLADRTCCIGRGLASIKAFAPIERNFLYQYFKHIESWLSKEGTGTTFTAINKDQLHDLNILLPPLNEQKRIVAKLDSILPKVKSAKVRLQKIPAILKKFRQSILAAACSGQLTEDWRVGKELPDWEETTIHEIAISMSTGPFGSMLHSCDYIKNGTPVINPTNISNNKIIQDMEVSLSTEKVEELSRYKLKENDIILARRGDLSKCGIVTKKEIGWIAGTGLFILRANINPWFFKHIFSTENVQNELNSNSIGSTMLNLNQSILGSINIFLPSNIEQNEIIKRIEKLFTLADSLETKYRKAMERVEKLEQSILAKAFRGELVDPDPNDEPAEELLKRILAEKEKLEGSHKSKKRKTREVQYS